MSSTPASPPPAPARRPAAPPPARLPRVRRPSAGRLPRRARPAWELPAVALALLAGLS
jgi:hypothetical protein